MLQLPLTNTREKFPSSIWINTKFHSALCFPLKVLYSTLTAPRIPLHVQFLFSHSSAYPMKKNQSTKKLAKPIKKTIRKTASVTQKSKALTVQVKPIPVEENFEGTQSQDSTSIPRTSPSSFLEKWPILSPDFYLVDALDLASRLLGKYLRREDVVLQITEVCSNYY